MQKTIIVTGAGSGIGKATAMVAIVHNLIKEQQQNGSWRDFTLHHLDTTSIRDSAKVRTQLAFELTAAAAGDSTAAAVATAA